MEEGMEDGGCSRSSFCALAACWPHPAKVDNSAGIPDADAVKEVNTESPRKQAMEHHFAREPDSVNSSNGRQQSMSSPPLLHFSYNDLRVATRNFRPDSLLGEGGFGCVFKGWIVEHGTAPARPGSGRTVAVKILNTSGHQGHKEWLAEINFLGQLYHPNLVKLIGFCNEQDQRLLVYECIPRGSLENHLFRRGAFPLPWNVRMKVALGVARGIWFLHSGKNGNKPVIYRDLKASNILLDLDFTAKLSDFGLAKAGPEGDKSYVSTRIMGTLGYAAPEYVMTGHLTMMSDVYSFGVLLLELLTGKRCVDKNRPADQHNLVGWARPSLCEKKKLFKVMDDRLGGHYSSKGSQKAGQLAHACLTRDPKRRPTMGEVVTTLEHIQDLKDMVNADIPLKGGDRARGAAKFSVP